MIIPSTWNIPESIRLRLGQFTYGRQRAIVEEGHLLLVLHKPPGPDDNKREGVLFWRNPAGDWQFNRGSPGSGALKRHVQVYGEIEIRLTRDYESAADTGALFDLLEALMPLVRAARNMHTALQKARDAFRTDLFLLETRDQAYEVERNLDLLLEDVRNEIQERTARKAEEQTRYSEAALRASHRLNMLAAMFFPLTALTSVFGMNTASGFNRDSPAVFWVVFICGLSLGFFIMSWVTGKPLLPVPTRKK
jgi:hypothetical protein